MYKNTLNADLEDYHTSIDSGMNETDETMVEEYNAMEVESEEEKDYQIANEEIEGEDFEEESNAFEKFIENEWTEIQGKYGYDISVTANNIVWIIGISKTGNDYSIHQWNGNVWTNFNGGAIRVAAAPDGNSWVVNSEGKIYKKVNNNWVLIPGVAADIGIGADNSVWVTGKNKKIYRWNGVGWNSINGYADRIAVAPNGNPWVVNSGGQIFYWTGTSWVDTKGPGNFIDVGVGADNSVWALGGEKIGSDYSVYKWNASKNIWEKTSDGAGISISVDFDGIPYVINTKGRIYKYLTSTPAKYPPSSTIAPELAVLPFNEFDRKAFYGPFLQLKDNKSKTDKNNEIFKKNSYGVLYSLFILQLTKYVDLNLIENAYKAIFPGETVVRNPAGFDVIVTEGVHQFQMKCSNDSDAIKIPGSEELKESLQYDAIVGSHTLDNLGFAFHKRPNEYIPKEAIKDNFKSITKSIEDYIKSIPVPGLKNINGSNWYAYRCNPVIFGRKGKNGHGYSDLFVLELRKAETELFRIEEKRSAEVFDALFIGYNVWNKEIMDAIQLIKKGIIIERGKVPRVLGDILGIKENHSDLRDPSRGGTGFHFSGLAMDINPARNPYVCHDTGLKRLIEGADHGISTGTLSSTLYGDIKKHGKANVFFEYLKDHKTTTEIYDFLIPIHIAFINYHRLKGTRGEVLWSNDFYSGGVKVDTASSRLPEYGFLNLDRDLVIVLRDKVGLAWGAVDFGAKDYGNGDIMHFDLRKSTIGAAYLGKRSVSDKELNEDEIENLSPFESETSWYQKSMEGLRNFSFWYLNASRILLHLYSLVQKGELNSVTLTNRVFNEILYPDRMGKPITSGEDPKFQQHWNALFNFVVTPYLLLLGRAVKKLDDNLLIPKIDSAPVLLVKNEFGLVQFPLTGPGFERYTENFDDTYTHPITGTKGKHGDNWIEPQVAADFYNAIQDFIATSEGLDVTIHYGDVSAYDPGINLGHQTHNKGRAIDIHYFGANCAEYKGYDAYRKGDVIKMNAFLSIVQRYGFTQNYSYGNRYKHSGDNNQSIHKDHFHVAKPGESVDRFIQEENEYTFYQTEDLTNDWANAIGRNKYHSEKLGWNQYHAEINDFLLPYSGQQNVCLDETAFAQAVAAWQQRQGLSAKDCDGIIGPNTWAKLKPLVLSKVIGAQQPVVTTPASLPLSSSSVGKLVIDTSIAVLSKSYPEYQFTPDDALWLARFVEGEAGGRDDPDSHAVIWAMFNRFGIFRNRHPSAWSNLERFLKLYSTTLQPLLNSPGAAERVWYNFTQDPTTYPIVSSEETYPGTTIKKVQYLKHIKLQNKKWSDFTPAARNMVIKILTGQIPNPGIGVATDFDSSYMLLKAQRRKQKISGEPSHDEWRRFTIQHASVKKMIWIDEKPNLDQKKNAFYVYRFLKDVSPDAVKVIFQTPSPNPELYDVTYEDEMDNAGYEFSSVEMEDLLGDWSNAIRQNQYYSNKLGWTQYYDKINDLLLPYAGQQNVSLGEEAFAQAVAAWQQQQGFSATESDGIIGPHTWAKMKPMVTMNSNPQPVINTPITTTAPSIQSVFSFNQWHAQKILDSINAGIVGVNTHLKFNPKTQLEKISRGEQVININPRNAIIQILPIIYHVCEQARQNNYTEIMIGSFIREASGGKCTGHCAGRCIDINFKGGSFATNGSVQMVINILNYLASLPSQYRKSFGFGLPFQGSFFGNTALSKFKSTNPSNLINSQLQQLIPQLGIVFPDNDNHLHIQAKWLP